MKKYDFLIVGAGLSGAVFANEARKKGKTCLVIDKRETIGGNLYTKLIENINVHMYGAHIFHTNNEAIWNYVNEFATFNNFVNSPIARYKNEIYNLPFNMNTFNKMWGVITPEDAKKRIEEELKSLRIKSPKNLEEKAISLVGNDIYIKLIKGYTEKQWGDSASKLPEEIINRLPIRFTYDNNYFNAKYQGVPINGYTNMIEKMLEGIEVRLSSNFYDDRDYYLRVSNNIFFTGMIDEFYNYEYGKLDYRSLKFDHKIISKTNFQGNAVFNYTDVEVPYTRIIEHKFFLNEISEKTVITYEYPRKWDKGEEPFYPINNEENNKKLDKYQGKSSKDKNIIFGGRLGKYKYYDMDQVINETLKIANYVL